MDINAVLDESILYFLEKGKLGIMEKLQVDVG